MYPYIFGSNIAANHVGLVIKFGQIAICMDATHGTNAYDFNLITAVVIDEFGEGALSCNS